MRTCATILVLLALLVGAAPLGAQSGETGYDVVEAVNAYRVSQGKPPLEIHPALMLAAQRHADWMAANHTSSHMGEGGSMPDDRAAAAGYVGLARENVAGGTVGYATVAWAVERGWAQSQGHRLTMLADAEHIGGGTAADSETQHYVLLIGSSTYAGFSTVDAIMTGRQSEQGAESPPSSGPPTAPVRPSPTAVPGTPTPAPIYVAPIVIAEPDEDGTQIHVVRPGQTAWAIAAVYGVDLDEMLALNGLTRPVILHPGDKIAIRLGPDATPPPRAPQTYTVQEGESAWAIAATHGITLDALLAANDLVRPAILQPGDTLIIPRP